jgi:NAD(P)-dependent dehydrogenase (short-subunit alcohol dehydrogenase family)
MSQGHAVIVGGTKGLGKVITANFAARGLATTVVSRSKPADGAGPRHVSADLETLVDAGPIVAEILAGQGPLRYIAFCQRYRGTGDNWTGELQVGPTATRLLLDAFASHFAAEGDRAVAIVSSVYAEFVGSSQQVGYHVAKAALNQLVRYYAGFLGGKGVRINAIMPLTYVKAENQAVYEANQPLTDLYRGFVPLGRMGRAEESADAVDFVCSEKASFITGQCLYVDGGVSTLWPETVARYLTKL